MASINPSSITVAMVNSVLSNSWSKNIWLIRTSWRDIVETISFDGLGLVVGGVGFSFWRDIGMVLGPMSSNWGLMMGRSPLLSSVSSAKMSEKINSVWDRPTRINACFMNESSSLGKAQVVLVDPVCKLSIKSSFFAVLFDSIDNVLDHISFISRCRPLFVSSFQIILWIFKGWQKSSFGISRVVGRKIFIYPNFAMPFIVKSDHSVIDSHGATFFVGSFETLKRSVKDIEGFCFSKLRGIWKPVGDPLGYYNHVIIGILLGFFILLVFLFSLGSFLRDKKFWAIGSNERLFSLLPVLVNEFFIFGIVDGIKSDHTSFSLAAGIVLSDNWRAYTSNFGPVMKERLLGFRHELKIKNIQSLFLYLKLYLAIPYIHEINFSPFSWDPPASGQAFRPTFMETFVYLDWIQRASYLHHKPREFLMKTPKLQQYLF